MDWLILTMMGVIAWVIAEIVGELREIKNVLKGAKNAKIKRAKK